MNFLKKFFSSAKKNKETIIFFIIHIVIFVFSFFCTNFINDKIKTDIEKIFVYVLDLIYLLITILLSLQFIIKQIYINRMSSKYVSRQFNFKIIYKVCVLLIMVVLCFINSYVDYNVEIIVFILLSIIYFFIYIFVDMKNIELERHINKKIVELIEDIKENDNPSKELDKMYKLYRDCYEKKEINLAIKVIDSYVNFFAEDLCKFKEYLIKSEEKVEKEDNFPRDIFYYIEQMITNENNASSYRVDKKIFITMARLMNKSYRAKDEELIESVKYRFNKMCLEKGNNFTNEIFRIITVVLLQKCCDKKEYKGKLKFVIKLYNDMVEKKRIDDYLILFDYLLFEISECKKNEFIFDKEIIKYYFNYIFRAMFYQKNYLSLIHKIACLESALYGKDAYDELLNFYKKIAEYPIVLENESKLIIWIEYFVKLIQSKRETSIIKEYYYYIFEILSFGVRRFEISSPDLFDWIDYEIIKENKEKILHSLFMSIKYNRYNYLTLFLDKLNKLLLETGDKAKKQLQKYYLEIYETLLIFALKNKSQKSLNFIVDSYKDAIEKMDKENIISNDLVSFVANQVSQITEVFIEYNIDFAVKVLSILEEMIDKNNNYRINKSENIVLICDVYFKLAFAAAERSADEVIRFLSNQIGWNIKNLIDKKDYENAQKLFAKGYGIFEMLVKIKYSHKVTNFVATLIVTMGSYCLADESKNSIGNHIISKIKKEDIEFLKNAIILREPVKKVWNISMACDNFEKGFAEFKKKLSETEKKYNINLEKTSYQE